MINYINGAMLADEDAKISVFDHGFMFGDGVYEIERTFGGKPFRLNDHLDRLRRSLKYVELDGDGLVAQVRDATLEVLAANKDEIDRVGDVWVHQIVTGGAGDLDLGGAAKPSIVVTLRPLQFDTFGPLYDGGGIDLEVSLLTRHFRAPWITALRQPAAVPGLALSARPHAPIGRAPHPVKVR